MNKNFSFKVVDPTKKNNGATEYFIVNVLVAASEVTCSKVLFDIRSAPLNLDLPIQA